MCSLNSRDRLSNANIDTCQLGLTIVKGAKFNGVIAVKQLQDNQNSAAIKNIFNFEVFPTV